jgi:hypothetical protein
LGPRLQEYHISPYVAAYREVLTGYARKCYYSAKLMQVKRNNKISRLIFVISHSLGQQRGILRYARACVQIILWKQGSMRQEKGYFERAPSLKCKKEAALKRRQPHSYQKSSKFI